MRGLIFLCLLFGVLGADIRAVVFDHGSVMVSVNVRPMLDCLEDKMGISREALMSRTKKAVESGQIEEELFWRECAEASGNVLPDDWEAHLRQAYLEATAPIEGMEQLVGHLQAQGFCTPLLSNILPSSAAANWEAGRYDLFDPVVLSCDVGTIKPNKDIFEQLVVRLGLEPHECLLIDDDPRNVCAARECGLHAIQFVGVEQLWNELNKWY